MGHGHDAHAHGHHGNGHRDAPRRRLWFALGLGLVVMAVEVVAGLRARSLVVLSDAGHYFADASAIGLALVALSWATRPATKAKSFGWYRAEVVAAFVNALLLWALGAAFAYEAVRRILVPPADIDTRLVFGVGLLTLAANGVAAFALRPSAEGSLNVRAAYTHVLSDAVGSVAVVASGLVVAFTGWREADALFTLVVVGLILVWAWRLTGQTLHILLEGTPPHIDVDQVRAAIRDVDGVQDVHDLHVWTLTDGVESLSAHIVPCDPGGGDGVDERGLRDAVRDVLADRFRIGHVTLEVERPGGECAPGEVTGKRAHH